MEPSVHAAPTRRALSILAVSLRWPPHVAGGYELQAATAVDGLRARGHRVRVLCGRGAGLSESAQLLPRLEPALERDGADVDLFDADFRAGSAQRFAHHFLSAHNLGATLRALSAEPTDALLAFNLGLASRAPLLAARVLGVPRLCWIADAWPLNHWLASWRADAAQRDGKPERLAWLAGYEAGFRGVLGGARMACASRWLIAELARGGYDERDCALVRPPLRAAFASGDAAVRPRAHGEPLRVLCASMLWEGKGQHVLLDAVARARAAGAAVELVLAGSGHADYEQRLRALARDPRVDGAVRFAGRLDGAALLAEHARAHVIALPSTWAEPIGTAQLEGMRRGLCALVSASGGAPETIEHGVSGLVVPAGDAAAWCAALCELERDDARRSALARAGLERAQRWPRGAEFAAELERELHGLVAERAA